MPKAVFLPLAFALVAVSAAMYAFPERKRGCWLWISLILLAAELFAVIYNLVIWIRTPLRFLRGGVRVE